MRVDFSDGQWAEIYTAGEMPRLVTVRLQDMLVDASAGLSEDDQADRYRALRSFDLMRDTLIAMVVKSWSYEFELSEDGTAEDVYKLPQDSYDKLKRETREHWDKAGFTEPTEEEETPPKAKKTRAASTSSA